MNDLSQIDFEIRLYERLVREKPDFIDALVPLAHAYTEKGEYEKALTTDELLSRLCPRDDRVHYNLACSYALLQRIDEALKALKKAVRFGYDDFDYILQDKDMDNLKKHPEFHEIIKQKKMAP